MDSGSRIIIDQTAENMLKELFNSDREMTVVSPVVGGVNPKIKRVGRHYYITGENVGRMWDTEQETAFPGVSDKKLIEFSIGGAIPVFTSAHNVKVEQIGNNALSYWSSDADISCVDGVWQKVKTYSIAGGSTNLGYEFVAEEGSGDFIIRVTYTEGTEEKVITYYINYDFTVAA